MTNWCSVSNVESEIRFAKADDERIRERLNMNDFIAGSLGGLLVRVTYTILGNGFVRVV